MVHLEPCGGPPTRANVFGVVAHRCGCWLEATEPAVRGLLVLLVRAWNAALDGEVGVVSTLLGPEGTRAVRGVTSEPQGFFRVQTGHTGVWS